MAREPFRKDFAPADALAWLRNAETNNDPCTRPVIRAQRKRLEGIMGITRRRQVARWRMIYSLLAVVVGVAVWHAITAK